MSAENKNILDYTARAIPDLLAEFSTTPDLGLSTHIANERLQTFGPNKLETKSVNGWAIFLRQFKSSFIYLLLGALAITLILGEYLDAAMILLFLVINTTLGFLQEFRSEKVAFFLNQFNLPRAHVLREGREETISSDGLVPGDIILLRTGDKIPADIRILEQKNFMVDETVLTGESITVFKNEQTLAKVPAALHEASNLGFSGTDVLKGTATALVLATGKDTTLGKIARLTTETHKVSDFEKGISSFSNFVLKLIAITLLLMVAGNILIKGDQLNFLEFFIFSVAMTISVIPEALPLVTTFSLSQGAKKLSANNVVVKRLSAVQDLGSVEILCSDKTGTLTENRLKPVNFNTTDQARLILAGCFASDFSAREQTEPFDIALLAALPQAQQPVLARASKLEEEPFNPAIRRNVVVVEVDKARSIITRGAPEDVMNLCPALAETEKQALQGWIAAEGKMGHRTIAVGQKPAQPGLDNMSDLKQITGFQFLGIISFVDEIKPSTFGAIESAKKLGVRVIILTGDSREVAGAVAHEIGLINLPEQVISGSEWQALPHDLQQKALEEHNVFYRVSPEQKFMIVSALHEHKMVGFLGEGINDAPALKIAGVSMVVDSAADIAREASDIILTQPGLNVIVDGIIEGRRVFANTIKYIKATLISNFGNFFAIATASFLIDFLPMLPAQILLVNLLSDTPMISISSDTADPSELSNPNKYEVKEITLMAIILGVISTVFDFLFFGLFYRISPGVLQTNWFIGSILTELTLIFSVRTHKLFYRSSRPSTSLIVLSLLAFALTLIIPMTSFGQNVFGFVQPTAPHLILILSLVLVYFLISEIVKNQFYKHMHPNNKQATHE